MHIYPTRHSLGLQERFLSPRQVSITEQSSVVVSGDCTIEHLDVRGALIVRVDEGAKLTIKSLVVRNHGWQLVRPFSNPLPSSAPVSFAVVCFVTAHVNEQALRLPAAGRGQTPCHLRRGELEKHIPEM
jgi:hypothetical protein